MKKYYIEPTCTIVQVNAAPLMAGSGPTPGGQTNPGMGSREFILFEEEEEE
jgi:hypothetical protein